MKACLGMGALALCFVVGIVQAGDADKDRKALEGTWKGKGPAGEGVLVVAFSGKNFTFTMQEGNDKLVFKGTYKIDPAKNPKQMDLTVTDGPDANFNGKTALAIYELKGDKLKWCANEPGQEGRPTDFTEKLNDRKVLNITFERQKK